MATYCASANCTSGQRVPLPAGQDTPVFLQASEYPDGLYLTLTNPNTSVEFSTVRYSCPSPIHTPIMFYHEAPSTTTSSSASASPYYSVCTVKPNNVVSSGRTAFSWGWSFATLPPSFNTTGFYALLPRFPVSLPHPAYTLRLTRARWPGLTMAIDVTLFKDTDPWVSLSNGATLDLANYPVTVNGLSFGFHVPAGMQGQSAAVDLFRANTTQAACAPAHAPLLVVPNGTTASVALRVSSFLDRSISTDALVPNPDDLQGGCAWLFPGVLPAGKPRVWLLPSLPCHYCSRIPACARGRVDKLPAAALVLLLDSSQRMALPSRHSLTNLVPSPASAGIVSQHSLGFSISHSPYAVALAWTPGAEGHPLRPYQSIALPGYPHSVIALLSGMGEYVTFAMEYMAKLDTCASSLTAPVDIRPFSASPHANNVSISLCAPIPVVGVTPLAAANDTGAGEPQSQAQGCAVDANWTFALVDEVSSLFAMGGTAEVEVPLELNGCPAGLYALNLLSPPTPGSDPEDPTPGVHDGAVQVFVVAGGSVVGELGSNGTVTLPENVTALRLVLTLPPLDTNTTTNGSSSGTSGTGTVQELSISLRLTSVPPSDASTPSASPTSAPTPAPSPSDASTPSASPTSAPTPAPGPSEDLAPAPTPAPSYGGYGSTPTPTAAYGGGVPAPLPSPSEGAASPTPSPVAPVPLPRPLLVGSPALAPAPSPSADGVDQVGGAAAPAPAASSTQQGPSNSGSSVAASAVLTALAVLVSMGVLLVS